MLRETARARASSGRDGCGKTTTIQQLARLCGAELVVQNLSVQMIPQTLLGGFKPLDAATVARPLMRRFTELFPLFCPTSKTPSFYRRRVRFEAARWSEFAAALRMAADHVSGRLLRAEAAAPGPRCGAPPPPSLKRLEKARKAPRATASARLPAPALRARWSSFAHDVARFVRQHKSGGRGRVCLCGRCAGRRAAQRAMAAARRGNWLPRTRCSPRLAPRRRVGLCDATERGDVEPVRRHPSFRLLLAMNPLTDVERRAPARPAFSLHGSLRRRAARSPRDRHLVLHYLRDEQHVDRIVDFYREARSLELMDGMGRPSCTRCEPSVALVASAKLRAAGAPRLLVERGLRDGLRRAGRRRRRAHCKPPAQLRRGRGNQGTQSDVR